MKKYFGREKSLKIQNIFFIIILGIIFIVIFL